MPDQLTAPYRRQLESLKGGISKLQKRNKVVLKIISLISLENLRGFWLFLLKVTASEV